MADNDFATERQIRALDQGLARVKPWPGTSAAVAAAVTTLGTTPRALDAQTLPSASRQVRLPAGDYTITALRGLMDSASMSGPVTGLTIIGDGPDVTRVVFDPATDGPLAFNDRFIGSTFRDISFLTRRAGTTFLQSVTDDQNGRFTQGYTFDNVAWLGPWKYIVDLSGNNNNSEFLFIGCSSSGMQAGGAWLHIADTNTSDQFLNYWWFGCKFWSTSAALIDAAKGGHFHVYGLDASDWCANATTDTHLFKLRGEQHAYGTTFLSVDGLRVESKSAHGKLLFCEWATGNVSMRSVDYSSQLSLVTAGWPQMIDIHVPNLASITYGFDDCRFPGTVRITQGSEAWRTAVPIEFRRCQFELANTPQQIVEWVAPDYAIKWGAPVWLTLVRGGEGSWDKSTDAKNDATRPIWTQKIRPPQWTG